MATFTITTAVNIDTLTQKSGSAQYSINGGYLTVDQHTRYGVNQHPTAAFGNIILSATAGGTIEFNSTLVRLIHFESGSGNVPQTGSLITQGSAQGSLIGVYPNLNAAPTASLVPMPATGSILIRQWNSVPFNSGSLTGITANAKRPDEAGWLDIVGVDTYSATVNRLNSFKVVGDWYTFGGTKTSGNQTTTYQIPSNGDLVYAPGVYVEISGSAGNYEFYPAAGTITALSASIATDQIRGKVCWISTAGLLSFGYDGTNSTGGFIPSASLSIRIPNIFFNCCTAAAKAVNVLPNATLATRYDFVTTGGGVIDIEKASICWYPIFQQPYSVKLNNTAISTQLLCSEIASPIYWSNIGVGVPETQAQIALSLANCYAGGQISGSTWAVASLAGSGRYIQRFSDMDGFTITNNKMMSFVKAANATAGSVTMTRVNNSSWVNPVFGGGRCFLTTCTNLDFSGSLYYDCPSLTTPTAIPMYAFELASSCANVVINGLSFGGLTMVQPYSGLLSILAAGCTNIKIRNIGSANNPLDLGGAIVNDAAWSRVTTTATVTKVAHGLKVNDIIYCLISSNIAAITVAAKTVTAIPTVDTFTFASLNAGDSTGTLTYYPMVSATVCVIAASAAALDVKVQKVYTNHNRTNLITSDNSSKNILLESVRSNYINAPLFPMLNGTVKNVYSTPPMTAQTSVYGTHWFDCHLKDITPSTSSLTWNRLGTVAIVTSSGHNFRTGDIAIVTATSQTASIVLGSKTLTATSSNAVAFTCLNAGALTGTVDIEACDGRVGLLMNEATSDTTGYYKIESGSAAFTSAGGLYMPAINDQVTFTGSHYIKGHTGFPILEAVMAGGTIGNYNIFYQIDKNDGNGYSSFKNLYFTASNGGGTVGSTTVTVSTTQSLAVGDYVWGTNIQPNAKITSLIHSGAFAVDNVNVGTVSGVLRFNHLPSETDIDPDLGFKFAVKIKTVVTNATAITSLYVNTRSSIGAREYQYPLDLLTLTLSGIVAGSDVVILQAGTEVVLDQVDQEPTTSWEYIYSTLESIDIGIFKVGYVPFYIRNYTLTDSNTTLPVEQVADRNYSNP